MLAKIQLSKELAKIGMHIGKTACHILDYHFDSFNFRMSVWTGLIILDPVLMVPGIPPTTFLGPVNGKNT